MKPPAFFPAVFKKKKKKKNIRAPLKVNGDIYFLKKTGFFPLFKPGVGPPPWRSKKKTIPFGFGFNKKFFFLKKK
ncbi:hypothetical protein, partial [Salmonella enterica]|uniref:hypothetical protein n=1 Tax=Salmonella enterica TaxID=28901 RepID=UPI001CB7EA79